MEDWLGNDRSPALYRISILQRCGYKAFFPEDNYVVLRHRLFSDLDVSVRGDGFVVNHTHISLSSSEEGTRISGDDDEEFANYVRSLPRVTFIKCLFSTHAWLVALANPLGG